METTVKNDFISKLGLGAAPAEKQTEFLARMARIIQKRIALRVMMLLSEKVLDEYIKIVDNDEIGAHEFLAKKIPNYAAIIQEEIVKFKNEISS